MAAVTCRVEAGMQRRDCARQGSNSQTEQPTQGEKALATLDQVQHEEEDRLTYESQSKARKTTLAALLERETSRDVSPTSDTACFQLNIWRT